MKKLSERLHSAMQNAGITTQSDLSRVSGVNQSIISKILAGKNDTSKYSGRLAAALGVSADWLINGSGSMAGDGVALHKVDVSRLVPVWDETGDTGDVVSWHESVSAGHRIYLINKNTGLSKAPKGSLILVNPELTPGDGDIVVTNIRNSISTYRFLEGGTGFGFLGVDDPRIPPFEITDSSCVMGVAEQILIRNLR